MDTQTDILSAKIEKESQSTAYLAALAEENEWEWVEGYKGLDKNMQGRNNFQYEVGKSYHHDGEVSLCDSGFHLCLKLDDVFNFYHIGNGNRFFKVRARCRKKDIKDYGKTSSRFFLDPTLANKLVASDIEILEELDISEKISKIAPDLEDSKYIAIAIEKDLAAARRQMTVDTLVTYGLTHEMAEYFFNVDKVSLIKGLLSMFSPKEAVTIALNVQNTVPRIYPTSDYWASQLRYSPATDFPRPAFKIQ